MRRLATLAALALAACAPLAIALDKVSDAPVPKGTYEIDKLHTSLVFRVSHLGFSAYTGRFTRVDARLDFDPSRIAASRVDVTIDPRSIQADNAPSDFLEILAGRDWLDAGQFPTMSFRSKTIEVTAKNKFRIRGDLTLHGVTKPIVLDASYNGGYAGHPMEPRARIGFSATAKFKRSDFGISAVIPAPGTTMGVGDEVQVMLETEFSGPPLAQAN
ncbi:MAG TPA: YceI family protein [Steroidobacteraceae bacterium]|nr:YceI family protein [Steroidobacteraceae bacterium]